MEEFQTSWHRKHGLYRQSELEMPESLENSLYMDHLITGAYNDNATFTISKKLKAIMAERGFHLRKWNCNSLPCPFRNAIEHILSSFMHRETWLWWTTSRRNDQNMEFDIHRTERVISKYQDAIFTQGLQGLMHNSTHSAMHQTELMRLSCTYKLLTMMDALKQD